MKKKYTKMFSLLVMVLSIFSLVSSMFVSSSHSHAASIGDGATVKEAIFMMGPPAAGKSHARKQLYPNYGVIDPDELKKDVWVILQKQYKEDPNSTVIVQGETHTLSEYADLLTKNYDETNTTMVELTHVLSKTLSKEAYESALNKNDSFVYDTTGGNIERMKREMLEAKEHGFKIVLVYVFAPLEVCLERNAKRDRSVPEDVVRAIWNEVQESWNQLKDLPIVDKTKKVNTAV
ncbi:ATP-binding protein [Bacillus thuringiensis]|uniref:ATP-binding protein n=1 Tax=Bacillus thuringiensis TaxID=1428 RepID=UPI00159B8F4C|nr:ATP-binding protein [Bacillus thuringiensis]